MISAQYVLEYKAQPLCYERNYLLWLIDWSIF